MNHASAICSERCNRARAGSGRLAQRRGGEAAEPPLRPPVEWLHVARRVLELRREAHDPQRVLEGIEMNPCNCRESCRNDERSSQRGAGCQAGKPRWARPYVVGLVLGSWSSDDLQDVLVRPARCRRQPACLRPVDSSPILCPNEITVVPCRHRSAAAPAPVWPRSSRTRGARLLVAASPRAVIMNTWISATTCLQTLRAARPPAAMTQPDDRLN